MTPTQKTLELRMKVTADVTDAQRNLQQLGQAAAQAGPGGRPFSGYVPPPGFGAPPSGGPGARGPGGFFSPTPSFDRPIPVVIVGPRPLPVTGAGAGSGSGGGGTGGGLGAAKADRAESTLSAIRNLQLGGALGRYEQINSFGAGAKELGIPGGGLVSRAALPAAIGLTALKTAGDVGGIVSDSYTTDEQKARQAFRKFVPFGETIQDSVDGLTGRKAAFERAEVGYQKSLAEVNARTQVAGLNLSLAPELTANSARAGLLARAGAVLEGPADRTTAAGEKAFRDRQRLLPLERESARAEREAAAAAASRSAAGAQLLDIEGKMSRLRRERTRLDRQLLNDPDAQSGSERQTLLYRQSALENEFQALGGLRQQARQGDYQAAQAEAQARLRFGQVGVRRLQTEAEILEGDAGQAASGAQALGGQDRFARANAVRSLTLLQQFGPERLSPQELAEARSVAPQTVAKILEQAGKGTREFAELQEIAPADYAGDPDSLRKKAGEKRDEAARKELDLERDLSRSVQAAGADLGQYLATVIRQLTDSIKKEIDIQKLIGKGASS